MNTLLGNRIKELRTAKKYTQEQVADRLGISRQKYARIESGLNNITLDIIMRLTEILDVTVNDITKVLEEEPVAMFRTSAEGGTTEKIFDMLDLFYANKHMYMKLQRKPVEYGAFI